MRMFVTFCSNEPFDLYDENVFTLFQLSNQYEVTNQYITKNSKPLIFQSIFLKLQHQKTDTAINLTDEENIVASNFFDYIDNEQLIKLPVPILFRIINKEQMKIDSMDLTKQGQFIKFLFKCLDKHKQEASVLFQCMDIENEQIGVLARTR